MATAGTLTNVSSEPAGQRPVKAPNRVAQLAAADIAAAEARAKVLGQGAPSPQEAFTTPAAAASTDALVQSGSPATAQADGLSVEPAVGGLDDIDMTGAPALRPMKTMRVHERSRVLAECLTIADELQGQEVDTAKGIGGLDPKVLELFGQVDLFMEKHVVDPDTYVTWTTEVDGMDSFLRVMGLFARFTERLGG